MPVVPLNQRVQKHRAALRKAGMRPVQLWVTDTRKRGYLDEARRQSLVVAEADGADRTFAIFMDSTLGDVEGWTG